MIPRILRILVLAVIVPAGVWIGVAVLRQSASALLVQYGTGEAARRRAVDLAPDDPRAVAALGKFLLYRAEPPSPDESVSLLQRAAILSPRDYRFWLELGRGYENAGLREKAGLALNRAVELAPRYFETRWALANYKLRDGRVEQALDDFRKAIELSGGSSGRIDPRAADNAFAAVAGALGNNLDALRRVAPADPASQAALASFLARNGSLDQSLELWRAIGGDDPPSFRAATIEIMRRLQSTGRFAEAKEVWAGLAGMLGRRSRDAAENLIFNPGFESPPLSEQAPELLDAGFDWIIGRHPEVICRRAGRITRSGAWALHLQFPSTMRSDFEQAWQWTAVAPGRRYRLKYSVRTRNVPGVPNETPFVEISDAAGQGGFAIRSLAPRESAEWSEQMIEFTIPEGTTGLRIGIRAPRLKTIDRARITELWYDDFSLTALPDEPETSGR